MEEREDRQMTGELDPPTPPPPPSVFVILFELMGLVSACIHTLTHLRYHIHCHTHLFSF